MATKELIQTVTVGASGAASIEITNIPQYFTDLCLVFSLRDNLSNVSNDANLYVNGSLISFKQLYGTGVNVGSNAPTQIARPIVSATGTANTFGNAQVYIPNYSSNTMSKTIAVDSVSETNNTESYQVIGAGIYPSNTPVSAITIDNGSYNFYQYSSVYLYGIRRGSDDKTTPATSGGIITASGGYTFHVFTSSGTFSPTRALTIDGVVIGGGGGGAGGAGGGGGGGGGYQQITARTIEKGSYSVVIGAGGTNGTGNVMAGNGGDSSFLDITSFGGAGGGQTDGTGRNGASGSGNGSFKAGGGLGIAGQGNNGGDAGSGSPYNAGGGGGAATAGSGQNGGSGAFLPAYTFPTSTGVSGYLAGGGGGGTYYSGNSVGSGGAGGGGAGTNSNGSATSGTVNTGGGGGGSGNQYNNGQGSTGGSGIVIIRYPTPA